MILYVDETENDDYFIVAGLLVKNERCIDLAYRHFKNRIKNYPLKLKSKQKVYRGFKSSVIDRHYQTVKRIMLEEINNISDRYILYSSQIKKKTKLFQGEKEKIYLHLITKIVGYCENVIVIYDSFNNKKIDNKIYEELNKLSNVESIFAKDSQEEPGLQFVDNLCSVIRLHISKNDKNNFYKIIASNIIDI